MFSFLKPGRRDPLFENRLVGLQPTLRIADGHLILKASGRHCAQVCSASFELDRALIDQLHAGDVLNLTRTGTADIGVSLLRTHQLVFAVGAVTAVPLGDIVTVRGGPELALAADDSTEWPRRDTWVEVCVFDAMLPRLRGGEEITIGAYRVSALRCFEDGIPGTHECVAISLMKICPHDASLRSAKLLAASNAGLVIEDWS